MSLEFEQLDSRESGSQQVENVRRAVQKVNYFGDIVNWCGEAGYSSKETLESLY